MCDLIEEENHNIHCLTQHYNMQTETSIDFLNSIGFISNYTLNPVAEVALFIREIPNIMTVDTREKNMIA